MHVPEIKSNQVGMVMERSWSSLRLLSAEHFKLFYVHVDSPQFSLRSNHSLGSALYKCFSLRIARYSLDVSDSYVWGRNILLFEKMNEAMSLILVICP